MSASEWDELIEEFKRCPQEVHAGITETYFKLRKGRGSEDALREALRINKAGATVEAGAVEYDEIMRMQEALDGG